SRPRRRLVRAGVLGVRIRVRDDRRALRRAGGTRRGRRRAVRPRARRLRRIERAVLRRVQSPATDDPGRPPDLDRREGRPSPAAPGRPPRDWLERGLEGHPETARGGCRGNDPVRVVPALRRARLVGAGPDRRPAAAGRAPDRSRPLMDFLEAALTVLREERRPLHWTVIQDLALQRRYLDPFTQRD